MERVTTIEFPVEMPLIKRGEHWFARAGDREIKLSNLTKPYWPEEGFTKGDLLHYYFNVSPFMLPHVRERPLTLKRMPNGVGADFFYEKEAPRHRPSWMPTIPVQSESRVINFLTVMDVAHMLWIANLGCIEFHPLHARGSDQTYPSYAFFDLDPFEPAGWSEVVHVASLIKVVLDQLGVSSYPKSSGATGMQIMIPLDGTLDYDNVRGFVGAVSDLVHESEPDVTTMEWEIPKRTGKVFLDVNMNREGANIAAAYSARPEPGGTVSTPFTWEELEDTHPSEYSMATIFDRLAEVGDPFLPVAEGPGHHLQPLIEAMEAKPRKAREIKPQ